MTPKILIAFIFSWIVTFSLLAQSSEEIKVKGKNLIFLDGTEYETNLFNLSYIGTIGKEKAKNYLILSGQQCYECDSNTALYIISPEYGSMKDESVQIRYSYPGKLFNYEDNSLLAEFRVFYGEVLRGAEGILWDQKELDNESNWIQSTYFLKLVGDKLQIDKSTKKLELILEQVKLGKAWEIQGIDMTSEP